MVEQGRLPSPEFDKPIQTWEVKAIPDAVEEWYKKGAPPKRTPVKQPVVELPPVAEEEERHALQDTLPAIEHDDVSGIVDAAIERLAGGSSPHQTPEAKTTEPTYEETIRALRIEEEIIKHNPELAMQLRLDTELWPLGNDMWKLLPHDAPEDTQRRSAHLMADNLNYMVRKAARTGDEVTPEAITDYFGKFLRRELPSQQEQDAHQRANGAPELPKSNITLEHVFAFTQRQLLHYYKLSGQQEYMVPYYQASVTVHNLLEGMVSVPENNSTQK